MQTLQAVYDGRAFVPTSPVELEKNQAVVFSYTVLEPQQTQYQALSEDAARVLTAEVIEKYRPALEELAK